MSECLVSSFLEAKFDEKNWLCDQRYRHKATNSANLALVDQPWMSLNSTFWVLGGSNLKGGMGISAFSIEHKRFFYRINKIYEAACSHGKHIKNHYCRLPNTKK